MRVSIVLQYESPCVVVQVYLQKPPTHFLGEPEPAH
jgi:hypothetical protein